MYIHIEAYRYIYRKGVYSENDGKSQTLKHS